MKIAICDDEQLAVDRLRGLLQAYLDKANISFALQTFSSGEELLESTASFDIIFLDINMKELDGIETASLLRDRNPGFTLVFLSAFLEYAPRGYEVHAFRYLLKSRLEASFDACMDAVLHHIGKTRTAVSFPCVEGEVSLFTDEIMYLESRKHVVHFILLNKNDAPPRLYERLDIVEGLLPDNEFIRIHKSYLANLSYIENIMNYTAFLKNNIQLPVSQSRFSDVKRAFFKFRGKM